jgi:multimeric flavodoxin WrbA
VAGRPKRLLIVYHSRSGGTAEMAEAAIAGAREAAPTSVEVRVRAALEADADDVRGSDAILLGTPENFGYMSGALKDFFDRTYDAVLEQTQGLPYALFVKAGNDGSGAVRAVERIVTGLRWREVQPPIVVTGEVRDADLERCRELGATFAAGLEIGVF